ncbi:right-handed parallel beta-helix repeat-containing protein [Coraliomargarita sp. W4R53]
MHYLFCIICISFAFLPKLDAEDSARFAVSDFGAVADGVTDDGPAIRAAVAAAIESGSASTVVFEPKVYRMDRHRGGSFQIRLVGVNDLTLEGKGATIIGTPYHGFIWMENCTRITMRGFIFDSDPLSFTQGDIVKVSPDTGEFWLKLHSGYANPIELTEQLKRKAWNHVGFTIEADQRKLKPGPIDFIQSIEEESRAEGLLRIKLQAGSFSHISAGDRFVFGLLHTGTGAGIVVHRSSDILLEDYTIHAGKFGMNHSLSDNLGRVRVNNVRLTHKPVSDRLVVSIKDGFHAKHNAIGPIIENCLIEGIMDDAINISVCPYWVKEDLGDNRYLVAEGTYFPRVGNRLMAYTPETGKVIAELEVLEVTAQETPQGQRGQWNVIRLDQPIEGLGLHTIDDLFPGGENRMPFTGLYNLDACGQGFIVRNNRFLEQRRHALLARGVGGLFEGNLVENNNDSAVMLGNAIGSFYEGPFPEKVIIRGNRFIHTGKPSIDIRVSGRNAWASNILIEDNFFEDWPSAAMKLSNIDGLTVRNNIIRPGRNEGDKSIPIQIDSSRKIVFERNEVSTASSHALSLKNSDKPRMRSNRFKEASGRRMHNPIKR